MKWNFFDPLILYNFRSVQKQLAFMLGRQQVYLELSDEVEEYDELTEIMSNTHLNNNFLALAREVNIVYYCLVATMWDNTFKWLFIRKCILGS